ncbi:MAG TPA: mechanosensitive ion channel family protein, partial [Pyrinomonadaceae bacterium]|nr:mechanosensitive ion channel family protein [Pyrinomonadaceae bacterium]
MFLSFQETPTPSRQFDPETVWQVFSQLFARFTAHLPYLILGAFVFILFLIGARLIKGLLNTAGRRTRLDRTLADLLGRLASAFTIILGLFVAAVIIFPTFSPGDLIAGLGITSVAIGFAFKDVLQNFFAGILILWRRPFVVGDEIRFGGYEGTVEEITTRSTRIKTYDGERAVLPNGEVYTNAVLVRTAYRNRRVRLSVGIGYQDSIERARTIIREVLQKTEGVLHEPGPSVLVAELASSSVNFTVFFWTNSRQANVIRVIDDATTAIKLALDDAGIDIP